MLRISYVSAEPEKMEKSKDEFVAFIKEVSCLFHLKATTLAGFDLTTHSSNLLGGRRTLDHAARAHGCYIGRHSNGSAFSLFYTYTPFLPIEMPSGVCLKNFQANHFHCVAIFLTDTGTIMHMVDIFNYIDDYIFTWCFAKNTQSCWF
jgi:hypothetical protein